MGKTLSFISQFVNITHFIAALALCVCMNCLLPFRRFKVSPWRVQDPRSFWWGRKVGGEGRGAHTLHSVKTASYQLAAQCINDRLLLMTVPEREWSGDFSCAAKILQRNVFFCLWFELMFFFEVGRIALCWLVCVDTRTRRPETHIFHLPSRCPQVCIGKFKALRITLGCATYHITVDCQGSSVASVTRCTLN